MAWILLQQSYFSHLCKCIYGYNQLCCRRPTQPYAVTVHQPAGGHCCPHVSPEHRIRDNSDKCQGITVTSAKLRQGSTMPNHKTSKATVAQNHPQVTGALIRHSSTEELLGPAQRAAVPQSQAACRAESIRHQDYAAFFTAHSEYQKKKEKATWAPIQGLMLMGDMQLERTSIEGP